MQATNLCMPLVLMILAYALCLANIKAVSKFNVWIVDPIIFLPWYEHQGIVTILLYDLGFRYRLPLVPPLRLLSVCFYHDCVVMLVTSLFMHDMYWSSCLHTLASIPLSDHSKHMTCPYYSCSNLPVYISLWFHFWFAELTRCCYSDKDFSTGSFLSTQ